MYYFDMLVLRNSFNKLLFSSTAAKERTKSAVVCTTGFVFKKDGHNVSKYGIYWGKDDPRNKLEEQADSSTHVANKLKAVIEAIKQAEKTHIEKLIIKTDLHIRLDDLARWNKQEFITRSGGIIPNSNLLRQLYTLINNDDLEIFLQHSPELFENGNAVTKQIYQDSKLQILKKGHGETDHKEVVNVPPASEPEPAAALSPVTDYTDPERTSKSHYSEEFKGKGEKVYVAWTEEVSDTGNNKVGYGLCWDTGETSAYRLNAVPATPFRGQLTGILEAITQAYQRGLSSVVVVTDSEVFYAMLARNWITSSGRTVANKYLYERIRQVMDKVKVRFQVEQPQMSSPEWKRAVSSANDGLFYPMFNNSTSNYKLSAQEIVREQTGKIEKGSLRVCVFKQHGSFPGGIFWDRVPGKDNENGQMIEENRKLNDSSNIHKRNMRKLAEQLDYITEKAISLSAHSLVIRTDSFRLIETVDCWLPAWERQYFRNSRGKSVANSKMWEEIAKRKEKLEIVWDLVDSPNESDLTAIEAIKASKKKRKAVRNSI